MTRRRKTPSLSDREKVVRDSYPNIGDRILRSIHERYKHGGNPLAAWDAFLHARWLKEPIPEWVLAYFEKAGERLCKKPKGPVPTHVMTSLGLHTSGRGSTFSRYIDEVTRRRVVRRVIELHEKEPERDYEQIYMDVAEEFTLSNRTVERWFRDLYESMRKI